MPVVEAINRDVLQPAGMRMVLTTDDVRYVQASAANVWQNLAIGAALATGVMFLFLRSVPVTLLGIIGIPICAVAAFLGLLLAGRTINVISLAGVAFAIGMTLDNTIVVLESIERERKRGLDRLQAALSGVKRVWPAVLADHRHTRVPARAAGRDLQLAADCRTDPAQGSRHRSAGRGPRARSRQQRRFRAGPPAQTVQRPARLNGRGPYPGSASCRMTVRGRRLPVGLVLRAAMFAALPQLLGTEGDAPNFPEWKISFVSSSTRLSCTAAAEAG
jgi:hypothetical protein